MRTLRKGDTGTEVKKLQTALNRAGCTLTVDGVFGNDTYTAVIAFQSTRNLTIDGVVGPATWAELDKVKPNNNQVYNALRSCLDAIEALPEYKQLMELIYNE